MRRLLNWCVLSIMLASAAGCASAVNPYDSEFTCPFAEKGKCVSLQRAYEESMRDNSGGKALQEEIKGRGNDNDKEQGRQGMFSTGDAAYRSAYYKKVTGLLETTETPMVVTSQAMRVLVLPYRGEDNMLFMQRFIYFFVDQPQWVLDNLEAAPLGVK